MDVVAVSAQAASVYRVVGVHASIHEGAAGERPVVCHRGGCPAWVPVVAGVGAVDAAALRVAGEDFCAEPVAVALAVAALVG